MADIKQPFSNNDLNFLATGMGAKVNQLYNSIVPPDANTSITDDTANLIFQNEDQTKQIFITDITIQNASASVQTWVNVFYSDQSSPTDNAVTIFTACGGIKGGGLAKTFKAGLKIPLGKAIYVQCETTGAEVRASIEAFYTIISV